MKTTGGSIIRLTALCFPLLVFPTCLSAQTRSDSRAVLEIDVVNATTNSPIPGARLQWSSGQDESTYARTDRQGHFLANNVKPGIYGLVVQSQGFFESRGPSIDLRVAQPPANRGTPGGGFTSVVYSTSQRPAPKFARSVDADGALHGKVTVPLLAYAVITGKVTDPSGMPMTNCSIELLKKNPNPPPGTPGFSPSLPAGDGVITSANANASADDRGEYRIASLEPGTYWLVVNKGSSAVRPWETSSRITYFPAATDVDAAKPIELAAVQTFQANIQIVRQAGVRVAGKLIRPPGAPDSVMTLPGNLSHSMLYTNITLVPRRNALLNANRPFTTGQEDYEFPDVLPGQYTLIALTRDAATDLTGQAQKAVFGLTQEVEVGERAMPGFDLALQPLRDLAGAVSFGEGCKPVPLEIATTGFNQVGGGRGTAVSGADGRFVLTGMLSGHFGLSASWRASPGPGARVSSIRLGNRDVQKDGFDSPYSGDDTLRIAIACGASGRRP